MNIIIPANNEAVLIGACLHALLASETTCTIRIIVVANGCTDATAALARELGAEVEARGWTLEVVKLERGHKPSALNAGDAAAGPGSRVYLDADVVVSPDLLQQISNILEVETPIYTSGFIQIPQPTNFFSRAYRRIYQQVPFMTNGVPGCGLFAVNAAGRARWGKFPDIIADDTFVRLSFTPAERRAVPAPYEWPVVEGWAALLRVRRRQNAGVREISAKFPALTANDDKPVFGASRALGIALRDPVGFAIYAAIGLLARKSGNQSWSRGR